MALSISPATPPVVLAGQTQQFTATGNIGSVTWSVVGAGSINASTGLYTAPGTVNSQQSIGGYQLLPNDHIYNTRCDGMAVNSNSASWIGTATGTLNYGASFKVNHVDNTTRTENEVFFYTPGNNGIFQIPGFPDVVMESGWYSTPLGGVDRHLICVDTSNGMLQESYDYYPAGTNGSCGSCTMQSGIRYKNSSYDLPNAQGGGVDAAGLFIFPLTLRYQEWKTAVDTGGEIKHAARITFPNGYLANSFIWPGTANASNSGPIPYGARLRLKSSFTISGYSAIAQVLLKQLQHYGAFVADGGLNWSISVGTERMDVAYVNVLQSELFNTINQSNFEFVDEASLSVSSTSGATTSSERVVASDSGNGTATQYVVLTGVTLNIRKDAYWFQAGAPSYQLNSYVQGNADTSVTWSMSPSIGTLTAAGLYTPPASTANFTSTTATCTSNADNTVLANTFLGTLPNGSVMRTANGRTSNYTDASSNVWQGIDISSGGYAYDHSGSCSWSGTDIALYEFYWQYWHNGDQLFDIWVPNGIYSILLKSATTIAAGQQTFHVEAQGTNVLTNQDWNTIAGGTCKPADLTVSNITVTANRLTVALRLVLQLQSESTWLAAMQITKTADLAINIPNVSFGYSQFTTMRQWK